MRGLAGLHARWRGAACEELATWAPVLPATLAYAEGVGTFFRQVWPQVAAAYAEVLPPPALEAGEQLCARYEAVCAHLGRAPRTLLHGDFRAANLGSADDTDGFLVVCDWQFASRGRGAVDLGFFLCTSLEPPQRRQWEAELISSYLDGLQLGLPRLSVSARDAPLLDAAEEHAELLTDLKAAALLTLSSFVLGAGTALLGSGGQRDATHSVGLRRISAAIADWSASGPEVFAALRA